MAKDKIKGLQNLTEILLKKIKSEKISVDDMDTLLDILRFHEYRYYILNDPLISDFEYDSLFKSLESLEKD